jgi:hypothetical protein
MGFLFKSRTFRSGTTYQSTSTSSALNLITPIDSRHHLFINRSIDDKKARGVNGASHV